MIELRNICKDYITSSNTVHALRNVSLSFRKNEFVAILGPSGGGKTTLLNIVGGLDKYTSGDLIIDGRSTVKYKDRDWDAYRNHAVGFVFQSYNLIPHQNIISNVELALTIGGVSRSERKRKATEALEKVGLGDQLYKKPNQLSGGQMQRVAIARALVNDPQILLADEPTGALDSQTSLQIMELLREVAKDRLVVMVTHNPELAQQYANRIITIKDGEITSDSNPITDVNELNNKTSFGRASMSLLTSFILSLNNLFTKKARTALVSIAGSIGIIGIALIMALSNGVNGYIDAVQKNSLSSYPLTIEKSDVDMTSAMINMATNRINREKEEGKITETPALTNMFSQIGANNLRAFKKYMEEHPGAFDPLLTAVQFKYGISPQIYKYETEEGILKINPSSLYASFFTNDYSGYSNRDTFQEMIDDPELLNNQYDVIAGHWPEKYNELVLVLFNKDSISDFLLYSLGVKDPKEMEKYINQALSGEKIEIDGEKMVFEYEDLLNLKFRLVSSADYYKYDETYDVWNDMRDDKEYMKNLVDNGVELQIVGIICPKDGNNATALSSGVGYRKELIEWVIDHSVNSEIVKSQLANKDIDVFTQLPFDEVNNGESNPGFDFGDLVSVDTRALSNAFKTNVNTEELTKTINTLMNSVLNNVISDTGNALQEITSFVSDTTREIINDYLDEHGEAATYSQQEIQGMVDRQFAKETAKERIAQLEQDFDVQKGTLEAVMKPAVAGVLEAYSNISQEILGLEAPISREKVGEIIQTVMNNSSAMETMNNLAASLMRNRISKSLEKVMGEATGLLANTMRNSLKVDANALQRAFRFNMTEEELSRMMMTYMNSSKNEKTLEGNLRDLGYADYDDPYMMYLYFRDFDAKEEFKSLVDQYNETARQAERSEDVIIYTDFTGLLISSVSDIVNAISYVLIAFVSVSLIVSSIMIAIITYISVLERTKEIGILRSLGASKGNVGTVFIAEAFIIGLFSGLFGVISTMLLCHPINWIVRKATGVANITAYLPIKTGAILVLVSIVLTVIAGIIPSGMASRRDPVTALRTE